jgi:hypothetical protein
VNYPEFKMVTYAFVCEGFLKVGRTERIDRRIRQVQLGCPFPVSILGSMDGDVERDAHVLLRDAGVRRLHGEWFEDGLTARDVLSAIGIIGGD